MTEMPRIIVCNRLDQYLFDIDPDLLLEASYVEEINGENSLTLVTEQRMEKSDRILTRDAMGTWREYVVTGIEESHDATEYYCVWSLQYDLSATFINGPYDCGVVPGHASIPQAVNVALGVALGDTERWTVGTITNTTMASASFYRRSGWEGIQTVLERWGGELRADITVAVPSPHGVLETSPDLIVTRQVSLLAHLGQTPATRRFDYGGDLTGIKRITSDEVWPCRIIPLGKSQETEAGGYTRRPDISSVNNGQMWLQDDTAIDLVRVKNPDGEWEYPSLIVRNDTYEQPADLKAWAQEHITDYTRPRVHYEATVLQFERAGMNAHGVALGDDVVAVDRDFGGLDDGLRISARVYRIKGKLTDPHDVELTIGNDAGDLTDQFANAYQGITLLDEQVQRRDDWKATATYVSNLIGRLNQSINATGGYSYITEGEGFVTYDVPVSDPTVGSEASKVVEVRGGNIRIADSRTAGGDWDWKTVIQSGHIAANLVTAVNVTAGYIGNASSGSYWDLDGGVLHISDGSYIGSTPVEDVILLFDEAIQDVDVEYAQNQSRTTAPTSGWSTTAPAWREGYYIWQRTATTNGGGTSCSAPTRISGSDGQKGEPGTSVTILGSYNTYADLVAAHPTGSMGDAYMVGGDLYVWNGTAWEDVGQIQGPPGADGANGTSVSVTSIQYGVSNSASAEPSSWSTTPPTSIAKGKWLWVKTNYSSGSPAITKSYVGTNGTNGTSVSIQSASKSGGTTTVVLIDGSGTPQTLTINDGEDGDNGTPGAAGYVHTAWANSSNGQTDFSTTVSANKKYLGVYTDHMQADSQSPSAYSWSLIKGADGQNGAPGADGADGVGITSIVEEYYLSTSSSSPVGGSWSTTQPTWVDGKYIWTRSKITWDTTPATVTTTTPVLAQGLNLANENAAEAKTTVVEMSQYLRFVPSDGLYVGKQGTTARSLMSSSGFDVIDTSDDYFTHIGTGIASTDDKPYYLFGPDAEYYQNQSGDGGGIVAYELVGQNAFSIGQGNTPDGTRAFAHGASNVVSGTDAFASGSSNLITSDRAVTVGYGNTAEGNNSIAVGNSTRATGGNSASFGYNNTASGGQSLASGSSNTASGGHSVAHGANCVASGAQSFAAGNACTASGAQSVAMGDHSEARGDHSVAIGRGALATGYNMFACGAWNTSNTQYQFAVGVGSEGDRSSVLYYWIGHGLYSNGSVHAPSFVQTSDRRLKQHVADLGADAAQFIRGLKPALFDWRESGERKTGFYAQDVRQVTPGHWRDCLVGEGGVMDERSTAPLALDYSEIIAPLVAYCQQLEERVEALERKTGGTT